MIIYATKQTFEKYKLKLPQELTPPMDLFATALIESESGNRLLEWGAKVFYFDRKKCIQVVNFASKFTLFLVDIKVKDVKNTGNMIANYLLELYKDDKKIIQALKKMFEDNPITCFAKLTDRSAIATMNRTQLEFAQDGYHFYNFISDGILRTLDINRKINFAWLFGMKVNGKTDYIYPGEKFRELILERYDID